MKKRVPDKFWFPWWPGKWIFGSVRIEFNPAERGIWVDLLSFASMDDGHIRANEETPYPLQQLAGMLIIPEKELDAAIKKFIKYKKLTRTKTGTLYVTKWDKYQFSDRHKRRVEGEMSEEKDRVSEKKDPIIDNSTLNNNKLKKITFSFNERKFLNITIEDTAGWLDAYPACDIDQELREMREWLLANPTKKKSNYKKFITNWLSREQDKGGSRKEYKTSQVGKSYMKELEFLPMELLNRIYKVISAKGESIEEFYNKAKLAFPKIKDEWEKSDKKPETFIKLVEEVK